MGLVVLGMNIGMTTTQIQKEICQILTSIIPMFFIKNWILFFDKKMNNIMSKELNNRRKWIVGSLFLSNLMIENIINMHSD